MASSSSNQSSSLRPAWQHRGGPSGSGRGGFAPPPAVGSGAAEKAAETAAVNKFAALDLDDDDEDETGEVAANTTPSPSGTSSARSEGLRSGSGSSSRGGGGGSSHNHSSKGSGGGGGIRGRSLADLVASAPEPVERKPRSNTGGSSNGGGSFHGGSAASTGSIGGGSVDGPGYHGSGDAGRFAAVSTKKIVKFTRERLLSMRPSPPATEPPDMLKESIGGTVILNETAQDPVCWDDFDAEELWATVAKERRVPANKLSAPPPMAMEEPVRRTGVRREGSSSGRWQRGVALPPPDQKKKEKRAENPDDLWDDPTSMLPGSDFSAFGAMPDDGGEEFDFEKMAEASRKLEEEMKGPRSRASSDATSNDAAEDDDAENHIVKVDPKRPLATVGTTIRSGSGNDVNVFEDFADPDAEPPLEEDAAVAAPIKAGDEDPSASSRLMAMIGVTKDPDTSAAPKPSSTSVWGVSEPTATSTTSSNVIPLNPWGDPIVPAVSEAQTGIDLQAQLREAADRERKAREAEEERRRRVAEQEAQRRAAQSQASTVSQQQVGVQTRVELVLMERISTVLENSWGPADLVSILATLHAEDSRVIPLLPTIDALKALILRNPTRVALRQDSAFGAEMAELLMTNTQVQQQQQQIDLQRQKEQRAQQEELQRRAQQQRMLEEQQKAAAAVQAQQQQKPSFIPGAPWFYSDPQSNIQGPFRGEEMRQWLEAGYFKGNLPISQNPTGPFQLLTFLFPDLSVAFMTGDSNKEQEEAEQKKALAKAEEMARREEEERFAAEERAKEEAELKAKQEAIERERKAKQDAAAEKRLEKEQAAAKEKNGKNQSSTQLKMMLGLSQQQAPAPAPAVVEEEPTRSEKASATKSSKSKNSNSASTKETKATKEPSTSPSLAKPTAAAWGNAAKPVSRKSMSEIQQEEARKAAVIAMTQQGSRSSSSGWANVAAARGGSVAWSGVGARPAAAAAAVPGPAAAAPVPVPSTKQQPPQPSANVVAANAKMTQQMRSNSSTSNTPVEDFGAKMSPSLEKWCKDQMQKLNGSDDLTLVAFCMTLHDPMEIRQYLTAYLGASPQVASFAGEFISRKSGKIGAQEEWETTATSKKSRRKKTGTAR